MCDDGDEIIIPEPYYANYNGFTNAIGVKVVAVPSTIDTGFALPSIEEFEKKITDKTRAIIVCNPWKSYWLSLYQRRITKISRNC